MLRTTRLKFWPVEFQVMKKMILCVLAGAIFSVTSGVTQAGDCCCPQTKCWSLPKFKMPHLFSFGCKPKCDPCAPACAAPAATNAVPAPTPDAAPAPPKEEAPKPATLSPSAADKPK